MGGYVLRSVNIILMCYTSHLKRHYFFFNESVDCVFMLLNGPRDCDMMQTIDLRKPGLCQQMGSVV